MEWELRTVIITEFITRNISGKFPLLWQMNVQTSKDTSKTTTQLQLCD